MNIDQPGIENKKDTKASRSPSDQRRDKKLYEYLLTLVDTDLKNYNESRIAHQWGMSKNRMFVRRVIQSISLQRTNDNNLIIPGITLNKLIHILKSIDKYRQNESIEQTESRFPKILTRSEKLRALQLYAKILPEEQEGLFLEEFDSQLLLQQLVEDITDPHKGLSPGKINEICEYISGHVNLEGSINSSEDYDIKTIIKESIEKIGYEYFKYMRSESLNNLKERIFTKVENAIQNIEYQNGSYQFRSFLDQEIEGLHRNITNRNTQKSIKDLDEQKKGIEIRFSPKKFIQRLTKSIIENQVLIEEFPVHIKHIEIQEVQQSIPQDDQDGNSKKHLFAYTVKVYFYIKNINDETRVEFYEEVTGVGSPLSHSIAAMNRALLWDIKSLQDYVPIAKQITFSSEIIGSSNNGSIWGSYVVGLCKRENINHQKNSCIVEDLANGDYCGFDTLEVYAKASFYARLRAIKKTGINSKKYIEELKEKIKQVTYLRTGEKMLNEYPFSLDAMKSYLTKNLLVPKCYDLEGDFPCLKSLKNDSWSMTEYEAHLSITESYLKEGLYVVGKIYLDSIQQHIENPSNFISKIIVARYHLCYFRYHYLTDMDDKSNPNSNRNMAVTNGIIHLDSAYLRLREYVYKCNIIDELPHINFYNFFAVMSELYAHKAKLSFFMSRHILNNNNNRIESILNPIELFQQARTYASRSGNSSLYSVWSAYLGWCYLVAAYTGSRDGQENYIIKAKEALTYGLKSYEKLGQKYYESIKIEGGKRNRTVGEKDKIKVKIDYETHGGVKIQGIPLIKEFVKKEKTEDSVKYSSVDGSLTIDRSLLTSYLPGADKTLLFGTQSSILIFVMAMLKLCHHKHNDINILNELEEAKKMFCYSWSFADDGIQEIDVTGVMNRWSDKKIPFPNCHSDVLESLCLSGLYPHRVTQFADFGKIFFIACELILLSHLDLDEGERWDYIFELIKEIKENPLKIRKDQLIEQGRYNGHLQENYQAIEKYVYDFKGRIKGNNIPILDVREKVVKDISIILRSGEMVKPSDSL